LFRDLCMTYFVYILTNITNSTLYIGVTNNIQRRIFEHREGKVDSFTRKYRLHRLIYYEEYKSIEEAIEREKQLKNWHRKWKFNLIKKTNSNLDDLSRNW